MIELFRDTYRYRELIWELALKELKVRYKRSVLGFVWALLHPALLMVILTLVFSTISRISVDHYSIFLISTLLPWTFFAQALAYSVDSVVGNGALIKKVYVPKLVFPVAGVVSNIINFAFSLVPLALLVVLLRFPLHWTWLYLPVPMLGLVMFTMGAGFFCAALNVYFRDVSHIVQILLSALFYFSPVLFSLEFIPKKWQWVFRLNPLLYVLNGFRLAIYHGMLPSLQSVAMSIGCGLAALLIGFTVFRRLQDSFVFYI